MEGESALPTALQQRQMENSASQRSSAQPDHLVSTVGSTAGFRLADSKQTDQEDDGLLGVKASVPSSAADLETRQQELEAYALNGILKTVRLSHTPLSLLTLGTDLTTLGLNLNAEDTLYASLFSPNLDQQPAKEDVEFYLPPCCYMNPPTLKLDHLHKLTAETLFYMFYTIIGDILQGYAAVELLNRGWLYHTDFQKWFTVSRPLEAEGSSYSDSRAGNTWTYFEPALWTRRYYTGELDATKFLKSDALCGLLDESMPRISQQSSGDQEQQQATATTALLQQLRQQQQFNSSSGSGAASSLGSFIGGGYSLAGLGQQQQQQHSFGSNPASTAASLLSHQFHGVPTSHSATGMDSGNNAPGDISAGLLSRVAPQ